MCDKCIKSQVVLNLHLLSVIYIQNQQVVRCDILIISYKIYGTIIQLSIVKNQQ